jgi:hypothetical protein
VTNNQAHTSIGDGPIPCVSHSLNSHQTFPRCQSSPLITHAYFAKTDAMNRDPQVHSAPVGDSSVQTVVRLAENELQALLKQQATIALRIQQVKKTLTGLGVVFGSDVLSDDTLRLLSPRSSTRKHGLTNACRQLILEAERPLRSVDICARLAEQEPEVLKNHSVAGSKHRNNHETTVLIWRSTSDPHS